MSNLPKFKDQSAVEQYNGFDILVFTGKIAAENMGTYTVVWPSDGDDGLANVYDGAAYCFNGSDCHDNQNWYWFKSEAEMRQHLQNTTKEIKEESEA